eukprot:scaffold1508_cov178-Amphora_coffeaeformis.AAC.11
MLLSDLFVQRATIYFAWASRLASFCNRNRSTGEGVTTMLGLLCVLYSTIGDVCNTLYYGVFPDGRVAKESMMKNQNNTDAEETVRKKPPTPPWPKIIGIVAEN